MEGRPGSRTGGPARSRSGRPASRAGRPARKGVQIPIDAPPPAVPPPESTPAVDIGAKLTELMQELADTKEELQRRKDSAMRKEVRLQQEVSDLKDSLEEALGNRTQVHQMQRVRSTHGQIQDKISDMQERTAELLKQQEDALIRNFQSFMAKELEGESKKKKPDQPSAEEWAARYRCASPVNPVGLQCKDPFSSTECAARPRIC